MEIWSVGHGARPLDDFLTMLRAADVKAIADVRLMPGSRRHPHFGAKALEAALSEIGLAYLHVPELGGRRKPRADSPNRALRVAAFRGYADHMSTEEFARGYERVTDLASGARTAVMCAETVWWRCHRRLIADRLTVDGWTVTHLIALSSGERHVLWDTARTLDGHLVYDVGTLPLPI